MAYRPRPVRSQADSRPCSSSSSVTSTWTSSLFRRRGRDASRGRSGSAPSPPWRTGAPRRRTMQCWRRCSRGSSRSRRRRGTCGRRRSPGRSSGESVPRGSGEVGRHGCIGTTRCSDPSTGVLLARTQAHPRASPEPRAAVAPTVHTRDDRPGGAWGSRTALAPAPRGLIQGRAHPPCRFGIAIAAAARSTAVRAPASAP